MKKIICFLSFSCFLFSIQAQMIKIGARVGFSSSTLKPQDLSIKGLGNVDSLGLTFQQAQPTFQVGLFGRVKMGMISIQPEVLLTSSKIQYTFEELTGTTSSEVLHESFYHIDIPIMAGVHLGPLRAQAGPLFHIKLNNDSELVDIKNYKTQFQNAAMSFQAGIGLDLWKLAIDLKYEFDLSDDKESVNLFGNNYAVNNRGDQFVGSLGFFF